MRNPMIILLARLSHPNRTVDPLRIDDARLVSVWDAVVAIESYSQEKP